MYIVFLELMIQHCHVYRTVAFTKTIFNMCQCRAYFSYFIFLSTNSEFLKYCSVLSCERETEKVVIWYNFQSCFTGSIDPTLCI